MQTVFTLPFSPAAFDFGPFWRQSKKFKLSLSLVVFKFNVEGSAQVLVFSGMH
jgi:hypothetical protein